MHLHTGSPNLLFAWVRSGRCPRRGAWLGAACALAAASPAFAQWVEFNNETATRLSAAPAVGSSNPDEKDYAWGDLDRDGDIDLVAVYKQLGTTTGRRRNVLFMNENGVLVDRTLEYASLSTVTLEGGGTSQGMLDLTNDRDVAVVDVNGDNWLDVVTATTLSGGSGGTIGDKAISHPRIYINLGDDPPGSGNWQGLIFDDVDRVPTMPAEPRFCSVSFGDLDGDGDNDLYFGDYQQGGTRPVDLNDRLWMNNGAGRFDDETATRMDFEMYESSFAMATAIADMNGDGRLDILKDDALNAPQGVSVSYNNNNAIPGTDGFFDAYEIVYGNTPYHIAVGDLNNDDRLDIVVTDDSQDFYTLNTGNGADGLANFGSRQLLIGSNASEFGGNNFIADLDKDGWNDVLVTSVDVDLPSCTTYSRVFRNLLNDPVNPRIEQQGNVGIDSAHLRGGHDIAVFDIDGDTWLDLVIGTCNGTTVYVNASVGSCTIDEDCNIDGLFCTNDICVGGFCQYGSSPCPGQACDETNDVCVDCLTDAQCNTDGLFCTNDVCSGGTCQLGPDPCPGQLCDESSDACVDCLSDADCDADGLFCTNDVCVAGVCQLGPDPCPGLICDEVNDECAGCLNDAACDADGLFCTNDICVSGSCQVGPEPCPGQICDEANDTCVDCLSDGDCDVDGLFCTNDVCVGGACEVGPALCPGQVCDEDSQSCVDCLDNAACDDGNICNGQEVCVGGACVSPGTNGVVNGTFDDGTGWTDNIPSTGSITYPGNLNVVGPEGSGGAFAWASQAGVDLEGANLEFDLLSYSSIDEGAWDRPVFYVDGTFYGLDDDGTLGSVAIIDNGTFGTIDNANQVSSPIHFIVGVEALVGGGPHEIGFGVLSVDGQLGAGIAVFDNVTPIRGAGGDPCSGQYCDPDLGCVDCLNNTHCDADGLFCTGDICDHGACLVQDPCPGQMCDEVNDACVDCLIDADCETDGLFCTLDQCVGGVCQLGGDACPGQACDEVNDQCVSCFSDEECDVDGLNCTNDVCVGGACQLGPDPCPGQACHEIYGCVECVADADCGTGAYCCDNQCQVSECVLALQPKPGDPLPGLTEEQLDRFFTGKAEFVRTWQPGEGLGPVFNRESCGTCHNNPVGGSGGLTVTRFGLLNGGPGGGFDPLSEFGGSLLQAQSIDPGCAETLPVIPGETVHTATRATPSTMGFGLVEAIEDADIEVKALNPPSANVSGRVHMVQPLEGGPIRVGRFGWKSQVATVMTFSGDALLNEIGITNDLVPSENAPNGDAGLLAACDSVPDPEDVPDPQGVRFIDRVTDFQRFLAPPPQTPKSGMTGEAIFASIGCTDCHTPYYVTIDDPSLEEALGKKAIKPYSDFLLHDVGPLGDGIVQGDAQGGEIRTPPLWGLRRRDPMLHDASIVAGTFSQRVTQAIINHGQPGSEAESAVNQFLGLSPTDQAAVVAFLDSLGRCEFDLTGDDNVDHEDYLEFQNCTTGPGSFYTPDDLCSVADIDQDGDVDDDDFYFFRIATEDCCDLDGNGIRDSACTWCDPPGACTYAELLTFADMGGSFGQCPTDGFANVHDANHALACFAGLTPCEEINIDAGGPFGDCDPDGFCNIHDANHALAAFAGTTTCTCPPAPAPQQAQPPVVASASLTADASRRTARPGDEVHVRVFIDGALADLRSYQLEVAVSGGRRGTLELVDVSIELRDDHVFAGAEDRFDAFNPNNGRMLSGLTADQGVSTGENGYLATYTYRVPADAVGPFVVDVLHDESQKDQTFLVASNNGKVAVASATPAVITVTASPATGLR